MVVFRRSSSGDDSLSLRDFADDFFSQPPSDESLFRRSSHRLSGRGSDHSLFSIEDLQPSRRSSINNRSLSSRRGGKSTRQEFNNSSGSVRSTPNSHRLSRRGSTGQFSDIAASKHGSSEDLSASLRRFSALLRKSAIEAAKRDSWQHNNEEHSKSDGFGFSDMPPPPFRVSSNNVSSNNISSIYRTSRNRSKLTNNDDDDDDGQQHGKSDQSLKSSSHRPTINRRWSAGDSNNPYVVNERQRPVRRGSSCSIGSTKSNIHRRWSVGGSNNPHVVNERQRPVRRSSSCSIKGPRRPSNSTEKIDETYEEAAAAHTTQTTDNNNMTKRYPSTSYVEKYLHHYLSALRLPTGFLTSIIKAYKSIDSRLWLMENTSSMKILDSHRAKTDSKLKYIKNEGGHSRWTELSQTVDFHIKMSARCFIPTKFWLVNDPGSSVGPKRFAVAWGAHDDVKTERAIALDMMSNRITLDTDHNHLSHQLRKIERRVKEEAPRLMATNKVVTIVLCTQGRQTDEDGNEGSAVLEDFVDSLEALSKLPVKIVVRLCANDEKATELCNKIDDKLNSVVVFDYWGEAMEVHLHNPWLTYGLGIHRLREACLTSVLLGKLGEKAFNADDIYNFCQEFFIGEKETELTPPHISLDAFMTGLNQLLKDENTQWNPVKKKRTPWIDMQQLERQCQQTCGPDNPTKEAHESSQDLTLVETIQRWSHKAPDYKRSHDLQDLLCTVRSILPPINTKVEPHAYFSKVPIFSKEAFGGISGDEELNELLKRAMRKMKFFVHPDKLPTDLTDSQTLLFETIWDVIQEHEIIMNALPK